MNMIEWESICFDSDSHKSRLVVLGGLSETVWRPRLWIWLNMSPLALIVIHTNLDLLFPWTHCQCRKCTWNHLSGLTAVNIPVSRTACNQVACTQCQEPTVPVVTGVAVHFYGPLPQLDISGLCVCVTYATTQTSQSSQHPHTSGTPHTLHNSEFHTQTYQHCSMGSQLNLVTTWPHDCVVHEAMIWPCTVV